MIQVSTGQADFYCFDEGQRESIRRIISAAKSIPIPKRHLSRWRGFAFQRGKFPARKDCGDDAKGSFAAFIHFFFHRGSPQGFAAKEGNYSLLLLLPHIPKQLDRSRPMPGLVIVGVSVDLEIPCDKLPE